MQRLAPVFLLLALALAATGCFQHTYSIGTGAPETAPVVYKHWHHHWLFGLIRPQLQKKVDFAEICPSGNGVIHEEVSFLNGLIDVLVGIVYSPTTVTIRCDDGAQAELELSAEEVAEVVSDPRFLLAVRELAPQRLAAVRTALGHELRPADAVVVAAAE